LTYLAEAKSAVQAPNSQPLTEGRCGIVSASRVALQGQGDSHIPEYFAFPFLQSLLNHAMLNELETVTLA